MPSSSLIFGVPPNLKCSAKISFTSANRENGSRPQNPIKEGSELISIYSRCIYTHINVLLAKVFIMRTFDTYQVDSAYCRNSLPSVQFTWRLDGIGKKSPFFLIMRKIWKTGVMTVSKFGHHVSYLSFKDPNHPTHQLCSWQFLMNQETHINPLHLTGGTSWFLLNFAHPFLSF